MNRYVERFSLRRRAFADLAFACTLQERWFQQVNFERSMCFWEHSADVLSTQAS
jgi:hypothetical protein